MWRTRDGYLVVMPRFRVRRLRLRSGSRLRWRKSRRLIELVLGRARRAPDASDRHPVFTSTLGASTLRIATRWIAPRRVELLWIGREA